MIDASDIHDLFNDRQKRYAREHAEMRQFEDFVRGARNINFQIDGIPDRVVANLAANGLRQLALRAGSVLPRQFWPPLRDGFREHEERARTRTKWGYGLWEQNDYQGLLTVRATHLFAHGYGPVSVLPQPLRDGSGWSPVPEWLPHEPLRSLPAPCANPLEVQPPDTILVDQQTWGWLKRTYGDKVDVLRRPEDTRPDTPFTFIKFISDEQITCMACSEHPDSYAMLGTERFVELETQRNKAEMPLVFVPSIWGLGGAYRQFAGSQGIDQMRSRILALAYLTAQKGADPATYVEHPDGDGEVVEPYNPVTGEPGKIQGHLQVVQVQPSVASLQMLSILEREMRQSGGIPAAFGAEAAATVQTGRMASDLTSSAIDYPIMAAQQRFERSAKAELQAACAIRKGWASNVKSFYVDWPGQSGYVNVTDDDFDTDQVVVRYPLTGSDKNNELLRWQQMISTGLASDQTAREMLPEIPDAEREHDRVIAGQIEKGVLAEFMQPGGPMDVTQKARVWELVITNKKELFAAIAQVQKEAQAAQAAAAVAPANSPETMSGLAELPPAVSGGAAVPAGGPPDLSGLAAAMSQLRRTAQAPQAA